MSDSNSQSQSGNPAKSSATETTKNNKPPSPNKAGAQAPEQNATPPAPTVEKTDAVDVQTGTDDPTPAAPPSPSEPVEQNPAPQPVTQPDPAPAQPVAPAAPPVVARPNPEAGQVKLLLDQYAALMSPVIVNTAAMEKAIRFLSRATQIIVESNVNDGRDVMWEFHQTHKNKLMDENSVMRGIKSLPTVEAVRLMTTYSLFRHQITKTGMRIDNDKAVQQTSRNLVAYLASKR